MVIVGFEPSRSRGRRPRTIIVLVEKQLVAFEPLFGRPFPPIFVIDSVFSRMSRLLLFEREHHGERDRFLLGHVLQSRRQPKLGRQAMFFLMPFEASGGFGRQRRERLADLVLQVHIGWQREMLGQPYPVIGRGRRKSSPLNRSCRAESLPPFAFGPFFLTSLLLIFHASTRPPIAATTASRLALM